MSTSFGVMLLGTGSSLPVRSLCNGDFPASLDTSDEWIRSRTGIAERRIAAVHETAVSLGLAAARRALESAQIRPTELDMIICATVTADMLVPSAACLLQAGLQCRPIPSFDVNAACTGFLYGLSIATQFIRTGSCRHILVVGTETLSRIADFSDRTTCVLFGDGAGAVVVGASEEAGRGEHWFRLYSDGRRGDYIRLNGARLRPPGSSAQEPRPSDEFDFLRMKGREVYKFAVRTIIDLVGEILFECNLSPADIDLVIPHQVNQRIIDAAFADLDFPVNKLMVNLDRYGNTSAASIPIALDEAMRTGRAAPGDRVLLIAFGGGLTWAGGVWTI
ncbi:MAG TPA: beta-ketoacyl-ACP synthase III [Gemmataceae bacterium]|nr:beta-ketoacyl-ACP synthase III [Gemmataceae bacterium]